MSDFSAQFAADDLSAVEQAQRAADREDWFEAAREARKQADRGAQHEDRFEALTLVNRQYGDPLAGMSRAQQAFVQADDEYRDAEAVFRKAEAKVRRAQENVQFFAQRAAEVQETAQRAAGPSGDPLEQAQRAAHAVFVQATRHQLREAALGRATRPKEASRAGGAGHAEDAPCQGCLEQGATEDEARRAHRAPGREVTRVATADGMAQLGGYYGNAVR